MRKALLFGFVFVCIVTVVIVGLRMRRCGIADTSAGELPNNGKNVKLDNQPPRHDARSTSNGVTNSLTSIAAARMPDWINLPTDIRLICGQESDKTYKSRLNAVQQLKSDLSLTEIQALYWFLRQNSTNDTALNLSDFAAIKNDVLDALIRQQPVPPDLQQEMVEMFRDHSMDLIWRDYCVQHFSLYYDRVWPEPGAVDIPTQTPADSERSDLFKAYDEALLEKDTGIAGTALLGLYRLSERCPEADASILGNKALVLAKDETSAAQTRVTAVAICGLTGKAEFLPDARILAQTGDVLPLRLAAIAVIGSLGGQQDKEFLEGLRAGSDKRISKAVDAALVKLNKRVPGS